MNKAYLPSEVESRIYQKWLKNKVAQAPLNPQNPFAIILPPPNATGILHIGHALDATIPDTICRFKRLNNFDVLFMPGTDHAGIATEAKVAKVLADKNINRLDLGKEKFIAEIRKYCVDSIKTIHQQWAKLGALMDFDKERFTFDQVSSNAVFTCFKTLFDQGLIYQGERIINFDVKMKTALSDVEVIYKQSKSKMYYFNYQLKDSQEKLLVATTRPETMLGDSALVVNPKDSRFNRYIGKEVINPSNNQIIKVIGDEYVDIEFGTGVMKCTPSHDINDFALGKKHQLLFQEVIDFDGKMKNVAPRYNHLDRYQCRQLLVADLTASQALVKIEDYENTVGYSERSNEIVEPLVSKQWFIKMKPLAKAVLDNQQNAKTKINFIPDHFEKILIHWLENIEDWCISRQIWWGHQIPVWYKDEQVICSLTAPGPGFIQDSDVLDTWFSSALWPFSTLGWPEDNSLQAYYPTDVMSAGSDLIFFWITRMYFQGLHFKQAVPFKNVLIHGLIRDELGRKVSKSLNNGVDLSAEIEKYGADALRFFLITNTSPGLDFRYVDEKMVASRNFINKLWNASRFVYLLAEDSQQPLLIDQWFHYQLSNFVDRITQLYNNYELALAGNLAYQFVYETFCSSYLELAKGKHHVASLKKALETILIVLYPIIPFVCDEIYNIVFAKEITATQWPQLPAQQPVAIVDELLDLVNKVRVVISEQNINQKVKFYLNSKIDLAQLIYPLQSMLPGSLIVNQKSAGIIVLTTNFELSIVVDVDPKLIKEQLQKELLSVEFELNRAENILKNPGFVSKAPAEKIKAEKEKLLKYQLLHQEISEKLKKY